MVKVKEKTYETDVNCDEDAYDAPISALFTLTREAAMEILRLSQLVRDNDLYCVEKFDYSVTWTYADTQDNNKHEDIALNETSEASTDCQTLCVSSDEFWYSAFLKCSLISITTDRFPVADLCMAFGIPG